MRPCAAVALGCALAFAEVCWGEPATGGRDPELARAALRAWCAHTLARPHRSPRVFVEAYFMRGLVAARTALDREDSSAAPNGLDLAIQYADSLVVRQTWAGYWPLGYHGHYWADMAAAILLFPAVEPFVDEARRGRYEASAIRFLKGLERDHMLLAEGAVGIGRTIRSDPLRQNRPDYRPYLISTALAGIAVRAWLYHRTGEMEYHTAALAALDYTLSKIARAGFADAQAKEEGPLRVAAYVQEGWMAADVWLDDPEVERRLRKALPAHVAWLLRMQRPDGTWSTEREDESTRTPPIVNFLVWYDQRFGPRRDVREAVRRAAVAFSAPEVDWYRTSPNHEVMRALAGRPLAALAGDRFVP